ncbi:hypothetical protein HDU67_004863, partial [Dinochytrium kinnereticum]
MDLRVDAPDNPPSSTFSLRDERKDPDPSSPYSPFLNRVEMLVMTFLYGSDPLSRRQRRFFLMLLKDLGVEDVPTEDQIMRRRSALPAAPRSRCVGSISNEPFYVVSPCGIIRQELGKKQITEKLQVCSLSAHGTIYSLAQTERWHKSDLFRSQMIPIGHQQFWVGDYVHADGVYVRITSIEQDLSDSYIIHGQRLVKDVDRPLVHPHVCWKLHLDDHYQLPSPEDMEHVDVIST